MLRSSHRHAALCAALLLTFFAADAAALDGYQDRRGLFAGIGIGGGVGTAQTEANEDTGMESGRRLGLHLHGILGGGVSDNLTMGVEGNWWARTVRLGDNALDHHHLSFNAVANFFLIDGFYVQGGVGLAYAIFDAQRVGQSTFRYQELGLATKAGAGFEFFTSSQLAVGFQANYTRHFYSNAAFDTISGGVTLRWY